METNYKNLNKFFEDVLSGLKCQKETRAYIVSIFTKYKNSYFDLSKDSVTITYAKAYEKQDFSTFQNLGDWIFFSKTFTPNYLTKVSEEYYQNIGRLSYYSCYKLINKKWALFEEIADNFITLENQTRKLLFKISY